MKFTGTIKKYVFLLILAAVLLISGCDNSGSSGAIDGDLTGTWNISADGLSSISVSLTKYEIPEDIETYEGYYEILPYLDFISNFYTGTGNGSVSYDAIALYIQSEDFEEDIIVLVLVEIDNPDNVISFIGFISGSTISGEYYLAESEESEGTFTMTLQ